MKKKRIINISLTIVSLIISTLFIGAGIAMSSDKPPFWIRSYGYLTILYGIGSAGLIVITWTKTTINTEKVTKYLTVLFLFSFLLASLDVGIISQLEWAGIIVVALLLWFQWFTVKRISNETKTAQPGNQGDWR